MASDKHDDDKRGPGGPPHPGAGPAARTPQEDHTPRQEEQAQRDAAEKRRPAASTADKAAADKAAAQAKEAAAAASIGAQIILDYNEDGSKGARGGAGATIEENQLARDNHLAALGLDPAAPSGPPPTPEALAARRKKAEEDAKAAADPQFMEVSGKATRMSSLAAGINAADLPPPTEPPPVANTKAA